jgi:hypothetical protein
MNTHSFSPNCGKKSNISRQGAANGAGGAAVPVPVPVPVPESFEKKKFREES